MNTITITDDFDLGKIISSGQCFRPCLLEDGRYRFIYGKNVLYIKEVCGGEFQSSVHAAGGRTPGAAYEISCSQDEWDKVWHGYFDLDRNYAKIRQAAAKNNDEFLSDACGTGRGIRILRQDNFETLISFIISQRKSIPAIRSAIEKLCLAFGEACEGDIDSSFNFFPAPSVLAGASEDELSACGLGYRVPYVLNAAQRVSSGSLDLDELCKLDNDSLFEALTSVKGVGTKVANCVMLFSYGRCDRAPIDTWMLKLIDKKYAGKDPFPAYGDAAGIMQQYAFYKAISQGI